MTYNKTVKLGNAYSNPKNIGGNGRGAVYSINGYSPTVVTMTGGNKPMIIVKVKQNG